MVSYVGGCIFATQYDIILAMKKWLNSFLIFVILLAPLISSSPTVYEKSVTMITQMNVSPCSQKAPINLKRQCNAGQTYVEMNLLELLISPLLMALISFTYLLIFSIGAQASIDKPPCHSPIFS